MRKRSCKCWWCCVCTVHTSICNTHTVHTWHTRVHTHTSTVYECLSNRFIEHRASELMRNEREKENNRNCVHPSAFHFCLPDLPACLSACSPDCFDCLGCVSFLALACVMALLNSQRYFDLLLLLLAYLSHIYSSTCTWIVSSNVCIRQYRMLLGGAIKRKHSVCRLDRTLVVCPFRIGNRSNTFIYTYIHKHIARISRTVYKHSKGDNTCEHLNVQMYSNVMCIVTKKKKEKKITHK